MAGLEDALDLGKEIHVRGDTVRELRNRVITLERPLERAVILPKRRGSLFAAIAESVWVLAGRDDIAFLDPYLSRAGEYSDDGSTWRGAYGPRLRAWGSVDQIERCLSLIREEPATRRAAMSLFDPGRDYADTKDVPCNNWLHWLVRDGKLNLSVALRSNDMMWGFSGINAFEWSVLHDFMALWSGFEVGDATFYASSFHLYSRHYDRARKIRQGFSERTCYDWGLLSPRPTVAFSDFDDLIQEWFRLEGALRIDPDSEAQAVRNFPDPLLRHFLEILRLKLGRASGWGVEQALAELAEIPESDLTAGAFEEVARDQAEARPSDQHPLTQRFWGYCFSTEEEKDEQGHDARLRKAIAALHSEKSAAYGDAWKKRGEQISILSNIARKVDRLARSASGAPATRDETSLDTSVDLLVYALKYQTFLADNGGAAMLYPESERSTGFSDGDRGFEDLLGRTPAILNRGEPPSLAEASAAVEAAFTVLESCVAGSGAVAEKVTISVDLVNAACLAVRAAVAGDGTAHRRLLSEFTRVGER